MAKHSKWRPCHTHSVTPKQMTLIIFDPKGVKSTHRNFQENLIKSLGEVNDKNGIKTNWFYYGSFLSVGSNHSCI